MEAADPTSTQSIIVRSQFPDVEIPEVSLTRFALRRADELADKAALVDGPSGRTLTYGQLASATRKVAASLARRGLGKGDVFAIFSPNLPEWAIAYFAVSSLGAINTTINPLATADELAGQLNDSGAIFLLTIPQFLDKALDAAGRSKVREVFVFGEAEGATPFASLLDGAGDPPTPSIDPRQDLVVLPYSSGTTGLPKGVMLTHHNLVGNCVQIDGMEPVTQDDVIIAVLPYFHIYGMTVILNRGLANGATVVSMPRFDLEQFLRILQDYRVTRAYLAPPIVLALAKHPMVEKFDLSALRMILSGAAPLSESLQNACAERLGCQVKQGYGLTESSPVTHCNPDDRIKPGSIGPAVRSTEYRVVDYVSGADLGPGGHGELLVRGPQVMRGYLNQPAATANTVDRDGWLHTGDIGYADDDGYFYVVDRLKELIKYKGFQVPPAELEAVLVSHPAVADAAVVPFPDEESGEVPKAFIVLKGDASAEQIMDYVAGRVAPYKKIRMVELVDQIPKSPSGKILRRVLVERDRDRATEASGGGSSAAGSAR